jgi:hypothetical protein
MGSGGIQAVFALPWQLCTASGAITGALLALSATAGAGHGRHAIRLPPWGELSSFRDVRDANGLRTPLLLALVAVVAGVWISACGGDSREPDSTRALESEIGRSRPDDRSDTKAPIEAKRESSKAGSGQSRKAKEPSGSNRGSSRSPDRSNEPGSSTKGNSHDCPASMTAEACAEAGRAYEQARNTSRVTPENECPEAMSREACRQVGEASEEAGESHVVAPDECPKAMTDQQCLEAGRAYQEAIK